MYMPFLDWTLILLIPAIVLAVWAQGKVKKAYSKYSEMRNQSGLTGAQVARRILDNHGLQEVEVTSSRGALSDHYNPAKRTLALSEDNYRNPTVAALAIAAHEAGHAIQHAKGYTMMKVRHALVGPVQFGSWLAFPLIIIGLFMASEALMDAGIILFSAVVAFHMVTLPVEFDASKRAMALLRSDGYVQPAEADGAKKMLSAAAWTYVAAATAAVLNLVRLILLRGMVSD